MGVKWDGPVAATWSGANGRFGLEMPVILITLFVVITLLRMFRVCPVLT
jgi:hypothetical protein